jgi:hypothetical protein
MGATGRASKGAVVAAEEPVTSPDQHKPGNPRLARIGAIGTILVLLAMLCANNRVNTGEVFLIGIAALLALILVVDWLLRKNGLR